MATTIRGRCLCGHVRYEYDGPVGPAGYCHCEDCRRCTGSAFNVGVRLETSAFRIVAGTPKGYTKRGDGGGSSRATSVGCGSPIFVVAEASGTNLRQSRGPSMIRPWSGRRRRSGGIIRPVEPDRSRHRELREGRAE
jgi:hypothetical protein